MSWYPPPSKRLPGSGPWRAAGKRPFGTTWWGKAWVDALEQRARLDPNRLPRGRTYARTGAVGELEVRAGEIVAEVQGSRTKPYKVTVRVRTYSEKEWNRTLAALASQVGHLAALLDGEMPPAVADDLAAAKIDLLPGAGEVQPRCSCPDWAEPCKHSAAVCYLVADSLDADPFLLFLMRGRNQDSLLAGLRTKRAASGARAGHDTKDLGQRQAAPWATDVGVNARQAWARWATVSNGGGPPIPAIPLPPPKHGRPTMLAVDPPEGSGLTSMSLHLLADDAAQRAWEMAHGERSTGLELEKAVDLARRAAAMLTTTGQEAINELASSARLPARDLLNQALAWQVGGSEGLFVHLEAWDPPRGSMLRGRAILGGQATVRRNRATYGERQLRLGRDGRLYPYRRSRYGTGAATWTPDGAPIESDE